MYTNHLPGQRVLPRIRAEATLIHRRLERVLGLGCWDSGMCPTYGFHSPSHGPTQVSGRQRYRTLAGDLTHLPTFGFDVQL